MIKDILEFYIDFETTRRNDTEHIFQIGTIIKNSNTNNTNTNNTNKNNIIYKSFIADTINQADE